MVRARCELPGYTTLEAMASTIRTEVNTALFTLVAARVDGVGRSRLARLLPVDPITRRSGFDRLKGHGQGRVAGQVQGPPGAPAGPGRTRAERGVVAGVPPGKVAHFAGRRR
ncbi:hypothetical protein Acsp05_15700 [Actinokineospora sp. NBRC 105648]|nr:hypothetical protein Acsp05_15700 [Actinokineospora sp. NBRC 105648]